MANRNRLGVDTWLSLRGRNRIYFMGGLKLSGKARIRKSGGEGKGEMVLREGMRGRTARTEEPLRGGMDT